MSVMLPIFSSLLLVMAVGGGLHTNLVRAEETIISNTAGITAYWQTMLPQTPIPSAILNLLTTTDGKKETTKNSFAASLLKSRKMRPHAVKSQILGEHKKTDDQNILFYGQEITNEDHKIRHGYGTTAKNDDQNILFYGQGEKNDGKATKMNVQDDGHIHNDITAGKNDDQNILFYGQSEKNDGQNILFYGHEEKNDDRNILFYGQVKKNDGKSTKSNMHDDDHKVDGGHIHGGRTSEKNDDQNILFYGKSGEIEYQNVQHQHGQTAKNDGQNILFYGQEEKKDDKSTKPNVQDEGHIHGDITTVKNNDQNILFYGQSEKNDGQNILFYGHEEKNDDQNILFYGQAKKNDGKSTKLNVQDDAQVGEGGNIHEGITSPKNDDQNILFYGQTGKIEDHKVRHRLGKTAKIDDQNILFYGQVEKNDGKATKSTVQDDGHIHDDITIVKNIDQNILFYGQSEKSDDQNILFYGHPEKNNDQSILFYGQVEKNDGKSTKSNVQDDGQEGERGHIHGGMTSAKNDDQNILFYGQAGKIEDPKVRHRHGQTAKTDDKNILFYGQVEKKDGKATKSNVQDDGHIHEDIITVKKDDQNILFYGHAEKNDDQNILFYGHPEKNDDQNILFYGQAEKNNDDDQEGEGGHIHGGITSAKKDDQNILFYGKVEKIEDKWVRHGHGQTAKIDDQNILFYGQAEKNDGKATKWNVQEDGYNHEDITTVKNNDQNILFYGQSEKNGEQNILFYGQAEKKNDQNILFYGQAEKNDDKSTKSNVQDDGQEGEGGHIHGGVTSVINDDQNILFYGQAGKIEDTKVQHRGGQSVKIDDQNILFYGQVEKNNGKATKSNMHDHAQEGKSSHTHIHGGAVIFLEDSVKPGSTITPHILPSFTLGASLLPRHVADSVPMSTRNFVDIMKMFAPASYAMAEDIRSTLNLCEHPPVVKGETNACIVSIESMVEFVSSVLRTTTQGLRALSSPDVPAEGIKSGKRYKVTELRRVTEAGDTVTCHGLRFPFAMFMCHAVNPTRVYSVTMEREAGDDDVAGPERMEALVVCHLDTSDFNPAKIPENVKPGEAPLCHFLASDNVLWARSAAVAA